MADAMIHFIQKHQPALGSGDYILDVTLTNSAAPANRQPHIQRQFTVAGERFALKPADIQAVFPPAGSLGDHSRVLPHISLNRSTLPWERLAISTDRDVPWLALLLFEEQEAPHSVPVPLDDIKEPYQWFNPQTSKYEGFDLEIGQRPADVVTVIDVPRPMLEKILPTHPEELKYLAHVRTGADNTGCAVVIGSRLPKQGGTSVVHLVSLEGCYTNDHIFNYPKSGPVRLISLYSWRFACEDEDQSFSQLLRRLDCGTLRLPKAKVANADAEGYLELGCVLLPYSLLREDQTIQTHGWYHGPLLPGRNLTKESDLVLPPPGNVARASGQALLPALGSASLKRYNPALGLLDVSYAAAWELGRFLALQSSTFSTELFRWKRSRKWKLQQAGEKLTRLFPAAAKPGLPPVVISWFERLERLEGVPFNYLIPDKRLLPDESLRLFSLDWFWMECLQDGALSIGRVTKADRDLDQAVKVLLDQSLGSGHLSRSASQVSGFLLRSEVVSGWPGLLVNGYDSTGAGTLLLTRRLATDILLCLFTGELARFEISLKAESMNFGVDGTDPSNFGKKHRDEAGNAASQGVPIPWCNATPDQRVIDIPKLAQALEADNSAQFAFQMIEGVEKVSFELH